MSSATLLPPAANALRLSVGDAYTFPLSNGLFGACRVVHAPRAHEQWAGDGRFVVMAVNYMDPRPATIPDDRLLNAILLTHHLHKGHAILDVCRIWLAGPAPSEFIHIGHVAPTESEQNLACSTFGEWGYFPHEILTEWRWRNERDALLADELRLRQEFDRRRLVAVGRTTEALERLTYAQFRSRTLFRNWARIHPPVVIAAAREILTQASSKLEHVKAQVDPRLARTVLRECVERFNRLNRAYGNFIETDEREEICLYVFELAHLAGLPYDPELTDRWREW